MSKFTNSLNNIKIASPCSADWNAMMGDERRRYCGECKLNVYNLSGMSKTEAENLIVNSEDRLCVRFYRRQDGTILTKDCPVGWRAIKHRVTKISAAFIALIFGIFSGLSFFGIFQRQEKAAIMGKIPINQRMTLGEIVYEPTPLMGNIAIKEDDRTVMGIMVNTSQEKRKNSRR